MRQVRSKLQYGRRNPDYDFGTLAQRLSFAHISSVISLRLLYVRQIVLTTWYGKYDWLQSLELYSLHTPSSPTCERCGNEIQKKNDCWVCHSQG